MELKNMYVLTLIITLTQKPNLNPKPIPYS